MGFTADILGLHGEVITTRFSDLIPNPSSEQEAIHNNGVDVSSSNTSKPFNAGVYGLIISSGGNFGTITIIPFDSDYTIQYLNCSSFIKTNGLVAPWTPIGVTGSTAPQGVDIPSIRLHLQIYGDGVPQYPEWEQEFVDPEAYTVLDLIIGSWHNHYDGPNNNGYHMIADAKYQITSTQIGSQFIYNRQIDIYNTPFGNITAFAEYICTIVGYADSSIRCLFKFVKCTSNISCGGGDYYANISLVSKDNLSGAIGDTGTAIFNRSAHLFKTRELISKNIETDNYFDTCNSIIIFGNKYQSKSF